MATQNQSLGRVLAPAAATPRAEALRAALVAFALGGMLVYAMGFSHPSFLHNAAHDWRHSMNFPCH